MNKSHRTFIPSFCLLSIMVIAPIFTGAAPQSESNELGNVYRSSVPNISSGLEIRDYYLPLVFYTPLSASFNNPRVNAPFFPDDFLFDEMALFWFGEVNPTNNYSDVRVGYTREELRVHVAVFDRLLWYDDTFPIEVLETWDAVTLFLDLAGNIGEIPSSNTYRFVSQLSKGGERTAYQAVYQGNGSDWKKVSLPFSTLSAPRGTPNDSERDSGWWITYHIPFSSLGLAGPPGESGVWGLGVSVHDRDDAGGSPIPDTTWPTGMDSGRSRTWGQLAFGFPENSMSPVEFQGRVTIRQGLNGVNVLDGEVGGHTNCGDGLDRFTEWGEANYAYIDRINVQNQFDLSDFPCFSKFYISFPLNSVPPGKEIVSASLTMYQFGNAGGGEWGEAPASLIQIFMVEQEWQEESLNWNNAPQPVENVSQAWVPWLSDYPGVEGIPRTWDVTRAVAESYSDGETLRLVMYSADSARHSGKYFWSSDFYREESRPQLVILWDDP